MRDVRERAEIVKCASKRPWGRDMPPGRNRKMVQNAQMPNWILWASAAGVPTSLIVTFLAAGPFIAAIFLVAILVLVGVLLLG